MNDQKMSKMVSKINAEFKTNELARLNKATFLLALACSLFAKEPYSTADIFEKMCSKCHGEQAQGNSYKGAPALNDYSLNELEMELTMLGRDGFQSSGVHSELMRDTLDRIEKRGMKYHPKDMAKHIYYNFNKNAKK